MQQTTKVYCIAQETIVKILQYPKIENNLLVY